MLMVASVACVLCWTALNYQRATGTWAFHPLDPAWWSPPRAAGAPARSKDAMDDARFVGDQMGQALWGKGGLAERADVWWKANESLKNNKSSDSQTGTVPAPSAAPVPQEDKADSGDKATTPKPPVAISSVQQQLELRLVRADADFQLGLNDLKAASPIAGDKLLSNEDRLARVNAARERFLAVERELARTIPAYENLSVYDSRTAGTARQLRSFNKQMLELTGGIPTAK